MSSPLNLQLLADAQALNVYCQGISKSCADLVGALINGNDESVPNYESVRADLQVNLPKLLGAGEKLKDDIA